MLERDAISGGLYTGDATSLSHQNPPFWAKLTSVSGGFYAWTEQYLEPSSATFIAVPGGRFGTTSINPAFEANGTTLTTPTFVQLQRSYFSTTKDWVYVVVFSDAFTNTPAFSGARCVIGSQSVTSFAIDRVLTITAPSAAGTYDTNSYFTSTGFQLPATGYYEIGLFLTGSTPATSADQMFTASCGNPAGVILAGQSMTSINNGFAKGGTRWNCSAVFNGTINDLSQFYFSVDATMNVLGDCWITRLG